MQLNYRHVDQFINNLPESWWTLGFVPFIDVSDDKDLDTRIMNNEISASLPIFDLKELPQDIKRCINKMTDCKKLFILNLVSLKDIIRSGIEPYVFLILLLLFGLRPGMVLADKVLIWCITVTIASLMLVLMIHSTDILKSELNELWKEIGLTSEQVQFPSRRMNNLLIKSPFVDLTIIVGIIFCMLTAHRSALLGLSKVNIISSYMLIVFIQYVMLTIKSIQRLLISRCVESALMLTWLCDKQVTKTDVTSGRDIKIPS